MITLKNQIVYKCEGCGKRFVTKHGAKTHESNWCKKHAQSKKNPKNCKHENVFTSYSPIAGEEFRSEPDYDYCDDCGTIF